MSRVQFTRLADNDITEIGDYIALDKRDAALAFVNRLRQACDTLADHPEMGVPRPRFRGGDLRSYPVHSYLIFYRITPLGIEVARVLHGARDFDSLFE